MDKAYMASTPMISQSVKIRKYLFRLKDDDKEVFGAGSSYLSTIGALLFLSVNQSLLPFTPNILMGEVNSAWEAWETIK
ncbi:hypothetical protein OSB04_002665 [Centaurea solstitialis]|uniref:Uncharacterized protein n=1 Tax=Centaurea solstitialis TaxID=347529 RepID=A0AA38TTS9_9ASTR|nr:hypothetical protein OSB04_002665 [Centaurea solstitialis]